MALEAAYRRKNRRERRRPTELTFSTCRAHSALGRAPERRRHDIIFLPVDLDHAKSSRCATNYSSPWPSKPLKNPRQWRTEEGDRLHLLQLRPPASIVDSRRSGESRVDFLRMNHPRDLTNNMRAHPCQLDQWIKPSPFTPEVLAAAEPLHEPPSSTKPWHFSETAR